MVIHNSLTVRLAVKNYMVLVVAHCRQSVGKGAPELRSGVTFIGGDGEDIDKAGRYALKRGTVRSQVVLT